MPLPGLNMKTQNEVVEQELQSTTKEFTEIVKLPGIDKLHTKPFDEIGLVLANLIKSKAGITALKFVVGSHIEITFDANPMNQIR
jgi:hypothetical protein